jgi:hypothetical protein
MKKGASTAASAQPEKESALQLDADYLKRLVAHVLRVMLYRIEVHHLPGLCRDFFLFSVRVGETDLPSVRKTPTNAGCLCITDFSPGPYLIRNTRASLTTTPPTTDPS